MIRVVRVGGPNPQQITIASYNIACRGATIDRIDLTPDSDGDVTKMEFYSAGVKQFTLNFTYDTSKNLTKIERTEP